LSDATNLKKEVIKMITKCAVFIVAFGLSAFIGGWALAQSCPDVV
jgi:hypothetical protein